MPAPAPPCLLRPPHHARPSAEKLYQDEVDFEIARQKLREEVRARMDGLTEDALDLSARRLDGDVALREAIPPAVLSGHRALLDERDVRGAAHADVRERLLPLEHSQINDVESSVAQKTIRRPLPPCPSSTQPSQSTLLVCPPECILTRRQFPSLGLLV